MALQHRVVVVGDQGQVTSQSDLLENSKDVLNFSIIFVVYPFEELRFYIFANELFFSCYQFWLFFGLINYIPVGPDPVGGASHSWPLCADDIKQGQLKFHEAEWVWNDRGGMKEKHLNWLAVNSICLRQIFALIHRILQWWYQWYYFKMTCYLWKCSVVLNSRAKSELFHTVTLIDLMFAEENTRVTKNGRCTWACRKHMGNGR